MGKGTAVVALDTSESPREFQSPIVIDAGNEKTVDIRSAVDLQDRQLQKRLQVRRIYRDISDYTTP